MNRKLQYKDEVELGQLLTEMMEEDLDGSDILERFMDANNLRYDDVEGFETLCEALGYAQGYYLNRDAIYNFLYDNPGALEALYQFVAEWVERNSEWKESLAVDDE